MIRIAFYITCRTLVWFLVALVVVVGLFVVSQLLKVAPLLGGAGVGMCELFRFGLEIAIPVVGWAATPAFVVAVMVTFGQMDADGETVALEAGGLGRSARMGGPVILSLLVASCVAAVSLWAGPRSAGAARSEAVEFASRAILERIRPGRVTELFDGVAVYVESRRGPGMTRLWIDERRLSGARQVAAETARVEMADGLLRLFLRSGAVIIEPQPGRSRAAMAFETLRLTWDVREVVEKELSFLPEELTASTATLLGPPPRGVSRPGWGYALWRRFGQVVGFLVLSLLCLDVSTRPPFSRRVWNAGLVAAAFAGFHLASRAAETGLWAGFLGPKEAAFLPSAMVFSVMLSRVLVFIVKRLSMR